MVNVVLLGGNLTQAPELKYTPNGAAVANLRVASNSKYKTASGELRERVLFIDVIAWGRVAESCAEYLDKGSKVLVQGELRLNEWEDRTTHQKRSKIEVQAHSVEFLTFKKSNGDGPAPAGAVAASEHNDANEDVPF